MTTSGKTDGAVWILSPADPPTFLVDAIAGISRAVVFHTAADIDAALSGGPPRLLLAAAEHVGDVSALLSDRLRGLLPPLVAVDARADHRRAVTALRRGAADYLSLSELIARFAPDLSEPEVPASPPAVAADCWLPGGPETLCLSPGWRRRLALDGKEMDPGGRIHREDRPRLERAMRDLRAGKADDIELEIRLDDGRGNGCRLLARLSTAADGGDTVVGTLSDITAQKAVETLLVRKRAEFEAIFEAMPDSVVFVNRERRIEMVNPAFCELFGYAPDEVIGMDTRRLYAGQAEFERVGGIYQIPEEVRFDPITCIRSDGVRFSCLGIAAPVHDARGTVIGSVGIIRDISERLRSEQALRETETHYRTLFEEDLTGNLVARPDGRLITCNPAYARIFGFDSVEAALERSFFTLLPDAEERSRFLVQLQAEGKLEFFEKELRDVQGRRVFVIANFIGVTDGAGDLVEIRGYLFDDTRRKEMENQFYQTRKMDSLGVLAGGVAHDFNNMLSVINGYCTMLQMNAPPDSTVYSYVEQIKESSQRAARLTEQILTFSRRKNVQPRVLDLDERIAGTADMLRRLIGEDIELDTRLEGGGHCIRIDPVQIEQVILNLAANGRDAMPRGGTLSIRTEQVTVDARRARPRLNLESGDYLQLVVADTGVGMDARTVDQIFEPFFTTKEKGKGTGLGLSMVYGIVMQNQGHIEVHSAPGKGTRFTLMFPVVAAEVERSVDPGEFSAMPGGSETILLVEDDGALRDLGQSILKSSGYPVLTARNGVEALDVVESFEGRIDMLVTDVVMPVMGGRQLSEELRKRDETIKVLFVSGYTDDAMVKHGVSRPGVNFLQKPFTPSELLQKIRALLDPQGA